MRLHTPWYHGWNIVALCVLVQMTVLGVMGNCFSFFLEGWSRDFHQPVSLFVLAIAIFSIPCAFLAPVAGWLLERWSVRWVVLAGYAGVCLAYALIGLAPNGWVVFGVYALLLPVAVTGCTGIPSQTLVSRWFVRRRGFAFSLCAVGLVLAGIIYPPIVVWLIPNFGWRATWWIFAAFNLVVVGTLILLVLRNRPGPADGNAYLGGEDHHALEDSGSTITVRQIFSRPNFWFVVLAFVPAQAGNSVLTNNFAPFGQQRGVTLAEVATLVAALNVAATCGKLGVGWLADRYGTRLPLMLLTLSALAGMLALTFAHGLLAIGIGAVLLGIGQGMWVMMAACIASDFGSRDFSRAYGMASAATLFITLPAPAVAYSAELTGSYTGGFLVLALACAAGVVGAMLYRDAGSRVITPADEAELTVINRA